MTMTAEQAQADLFQNVYAPVFLEKLANHGIRFSSQEDLNAALETAAMLKVSEAQARDAGIDTTPSPVKEARDILKQAMFASQQAAPMAVQQSNTIKEAAAAILAAKRGAVQ